MSPSSKTVHLPTSEDIAENRIDHGDMGVETRAVYGRAAVEVGAPDHESNTPRTNAVDAITNILHWLADEDPHAPEVVLAACSFTSRLSSAVRSDAGSSSTRTAHGH